MVSGPDRIDRALVVTGGDADASVWRRTLRGATDYALCTLHDVEGALSALLAATTSGGPQRRCLIAFDCDIDNLESVMRVATPALLGLMARGTVTLLVSMSPESSTPGDDTLEVFERCVVVPHEAAEPFVVWAGQGEAYED